MNLGGGISEQDLGTGQINPLTLNLEGLHCGNIKSMRWKRMKGRTVNVTGLCIHRIVVGRNVHRRAGNAGPALALYMLSSTCLHSLYVHQESIPRYPTGALQSSLYSPTSYLVFLTLMYF
jgi:hypothetical protein